MIKNVVLLAFCSIMLPNNLYSDDSAVDIYSGTAKVMTTHPSIQMIGEDVTITLSTASSYDVDATFRFYNQDKSTTVIVGFPMKGFQPGDVYVAGEFESFHTYVNNKEVSVLERCDQVERDGVVMDAKWKVKEVYFPENEETVTRVKYTAPYGETVGANFVNYIIGTGASWHGNIGPSTFTVIFPDSLYLDLRNPFSKGSTLEGRHVFRRTKNAMTWVTTEFKPKEREHFSFDVYKYRQPWEDFQYSAKIVGQKLLEKLTLQQLKIIRNEMFAVHGRIFTDPVLKEYFSSKTWYSPKEDFSDSLLTDTEKKNIKKISDYEKYLISLLPACKEPGNDWSGMKLKGNVKSIGEIQYWAVEKDGSAQKGARLDPITWRGLNSVTHFNNKGNKISQEQLDLDGGTVSKYTYKYNSKGSLVEERWGGEHPGLCVIPYDNKGHKIENTCSAPDGGKIVYSYGDNGSLSEVTRYAPDGLVVESSMYDKNGDKTEGVYKFNVRRIFKYDAGGNVSKVITYSPDGEEHDVTCYKYKYDEQGNWVQQIDYDYDSPRYVIERTIEYY